MSSDYRFVQNWYLIPDPCLKTMVKVDEIEAQFLGGSMGSILGLLRLSLRCVHYGFHCRPLGESFIGSVSNAWCHETLSSALSVKNSMASDNMGVLVG